MSLSKAAHLVRRYREMGTPVTTAREDADFARRHLEEAEFDLWMSMDPRDRRHAVGVTRRFLVAVPGATRAERAAALLHDVGKTESSLGRTGRVMATVFGGRTPRWRIYLRHEQLGAEAVSRIGGDPRTVELIAGNVDDDVMRALRAADDA